MSVERGLWARELGRTFDGRRPLAGVNLTAPPGRVTVVLGRNGAGKTTLLRIFATVLRPDTGEAYVDGLDVIRCGAEVRRRIGVAFVNERSLFWRLSGRENLELFGRTRGLPRATIPAEVKRLGTALGFGDLLARRVADLSTGERQRLIIARAVIGSPPVLLLDEPLRGLDEPGLEVVLSLLRARADEGATVFVTAPLGERLVRVADAVLRLNDGQLSPDHQR